MKGPVDGRFIVFDAADKESYMVIKVLYDASREPFDGRIDFTCP